MTKEWKIIACDYTIIPILSGLSAGICIAIGGLLNILMLYAEYSISKNSTLTITSELIKFGGAYCFSFGLLIVCLFRFQLYTGKIGKIFETRQSMQFYLSLPLMLIGNVCGAILIGVSVHVVVKNNEILIPINRICNNKISFDSSTYFKCIMNGIYCGLCVYFAVTTFQREVSMKFCFAIILLQFFVSMFVYNGFEHCIANAFYFAAGAKFDSKYAYINFVLVAIGNTLGTIPGVILFNNFNVMVSHENKVSFSITSKRKEQNIIELEFTESNEVLHA